MGLKSKVTTLIQMAPVREFANGVHLKGLFREEFKQYGVSKSELKRLEAMGVLKSGNVKMKIGDRIFYSLPE